MNLNTIKTTRTAEDEKFAAMSAEARATNAAWNADRIVGFPTRRAYATIEINSISSVFPRVAVYNSFSRDALKSRGYKFDGATKAWYIRRDSVADAKIEAEKLAAEIGIQLGAAMTREDHAEMCENTK